MSALLHEAAAIGRDVPEERHRLKITLGGRETSVTVRMQRPKRPRGTVICAAGIAASGAEFCVLALRLRERGFNVVYPDWIGHGDSGEPDDPAWYGWDQYLRTLRLVRSRYSTENTHFLGVSWGGVITLLLLVTRRIAARSAVFVDQPLRSGDGFEPGFLRLIEQCRARFDSIEDAERFLYGRRPDLADVPPELQDYYRAARFAWRDGMVRYKCHPTAVEIAMRQSAGRFDRLQVIRRIRFPALFLYGARSPYREPEGFAALCRRMPNIAYNDDLEGGHPPALLRAEAIEPIVDYLTRRA